MFWEPPENGIVNIVGTKTTWREGNSLNLFVIYNSVRELVKELTKAAISAVSWFGSTESFPSCRGKDKMKINQT